MARLKRNFRIVVPVTGFADYLDAYPDFKAEVEEQAAVAAAEAIRAALAEYVAPLAPPPVRVEADTAKPRALIDDGTTNASGVFTFSYSGTTPRAVRVVARLKGYVPPPVISDSISATGLSVPVVMNDDPTVNMP